MSATVECGGPALVVKLRNLSSEGALVEGRGLPAVDAVVLFRKNELALPGRVVWHEGLKAGIAFDRELPKDDVLRHVPTPRPRAKLDFRRPGLRSGELTPGERRIAEDWIFGSPHPRLGD
jgi:hypothetical protein